MPPFAHLLPAHAACSEMTNIFLNDCSEMINFLDDCSEMTNFLDDCSEMINFLDDSSVWRQKGLSTYCSFQKNVFAMVFRQ